MKRLGIPAFCRSLWRLLKAEPQIPSTLKDNQLLSIILKRRSIRRFSGRDIPEDVFAAILEAGRLAPSTVNLQTWSFAVFNVNSWRETFGLPIPFKGKRAVMVLGDIHRNRALAALFPPSPLVEYTIAVMNASLAAMNMNMAAEALGISSIMLSETGRSGLLDIGYLRRALALPPGVFPLMTIIFGYAWGSYPPMPPKLPLAQICFEGRYREADSAVLEDWLAQMVVGYKASRPLSSFDAQLLVYRSKIGLAEADLHQMVFRE